MLAKEINLAFVIFCVLFLLAPLFPQSIHHGFAFIFRSFVFLLFSVVLYRIGSERLMPQLTSSPLFWPILSALILLSAGYFYTPAPYFAKEKIIMYITLLLLFLLVQLFPFTYRQVHWICGSLIAGGVVAASYALWQQWIGHDELIASLQQNMAYDEVMQRELINTLQANRALGRFGNPNHLAGYLVLCLWVISYLYQMIDSVWIKRLLNLSGVLFIAAIYQTFSRSGLLALLFSLLIMFGLPWLRNKSWMCKRTVVIGLSLCLLPALLVLLFAPSNLLGGRLLTTSTIVARIHFFRGALLTIRDHPLLGVGPEGFEALYSQYLRPGDLETRYVHNIFLEAGVEGGFIGLMISFWLLIALLRFIYCLARQRPELQIVIYTASGALGVFLLLSLVDFHNNLMEMWLVPLFFIGLLSQYSESITQKSPQILKQERSVWAYRLAGYTTGILLLCVWVLFVYCRYYNKEARELARLLVLDNQPLVALQEYERSVWYDRTDADSWNSLGHTWAHHPSPTALIQRMEAMKKAVDAAPLRPSFHADYADALFALGYRDRALEEMRTAQRLFPAKPQYYERLALMYQALGMGDAAQEQKQQAERLKQEIEERRL